MTTLTPTVLRAGESLPAAPEPVVVPDPRAWSDDAIDGLQRFACAGAVVIVIEPGTNPRWHHLLGTTPGRAIPAGEVVISTDGHGATRNLPEESVLELALPSAGARCSLSPQAGTSTVAAAVIQLERRTVVSWRSCGAGSAIGVALPLGIAMPVPGSSTMGPVNVIASTLRRLARGPVTPVASRGIGIVGYGQHGGMGWVHGNAARAVDGLHLAAIAELSPARLADAGARFTEAGMHDSVDGLLEDDSVEVVVIATPPSTHADLARRALQQGRHVVVEKPMCFTAAEADVLIATAGANDRLLTVHQNRRWDADFRAVRRVIDEGQLGEVFNIETFVGGFEHPCTLWHSDTLVSGGRLYDWGAHLLDQTLQLFGGAKPVEVSAVGHKRVWHDVTNLDQVRVRLRFDDGREAEFLDSDILAVRRPKYLVQGTRGTLTGYYAPVVEERVTADAGYQLTEHHHAEGPARLHLATHHAAWGLHEAAVPGLPAGAHPFHKALADHLDFGDPVPVEATSVRTVTAVLEAATTSAAAGGAVQMLEGP